jgi:hypothetical protein
MVAAAARLYGQGPSATAEARALPRFGRRLDFVYFFSGAPERALERFEDNVAADYAAGNEVLAIWTPLYAPVRRTERFKQFLRDAGYVEYWRAKGWPSFCRPTDGDDFFCG